MPSTEAGPSSPSSGYKLAYVTQTSTVTVLVTRYGCPSQPYRISAWMFYADGPLIG